ncbi:small conductance mechanosensitive channel [Amphibacillus marinus]|uniref:Small conductance mechanosensitive channel n=1 Tax=Amphibacillus marinus TaxID=872970 RepID=A0A1H8IAB2_9BACI|nr:mechanosensitive ion channel family protein [Amphibacillus marinus]SEN65271.1 small conductance mechanosensitive channel [Amphibacillus marinus]
MSFNLDTILEVSLGIGLQLILLIVAYVLINPLGRRLITKIINNFTKKRNVSEARSLTLEKLLLNVFSYILGFIFITMLFGIFSLDIGPLLASAGVVGLAIGFGAQGLVSDVVTGFFILLEKQIDVGEYVSAAGFDGIVEEVGLRTTKLRSFDGTLNFIPNRQLEVVSNHSRGTMRALVDINISYQTNLDKALTVLQDVCQNFVTDDRFTDGPNVIGVHQIDNTSITLRVIGQTENMKQWAAEYDLRKAIKQAFDDNNIGSPFTQHVNFVKKETKLED